MDRLQVDLPAVTSQVPRPLLGQRAEVPKHLFDERALQLKVVALGQLLRMS